MNARGSAREENDNRQGDDDGSSDSSIMTTQSGTSAGSLLEAWRRGSLPQAWRHTLGIVLLLVTVLLWTTSNFLASTIFADDTYSKPFLVTYINSSFFLVPLIPSFILYSRKNSDEVDTLKALWKSKVHRYTHGAGKKNTEEQDAFLEPEDNDDDDLQSSSVEQLAVSSPTRSLSSSTTVPLSLVGIAKLAFEFSLVWFLANYFTAACLEHTSVASSTILTSTSSVWTLIIGAVWGVERFSVRKLLGVLASLTGVILISMVDMSGESDKNRGTFPHKSQQEIAVGNTLAFLSALLYGFYAVFMKKRIGDESRINMPLFFGFVGLINVMMLWPGLVVLHLSGIERFELPPSQQVLTIVLVNSTSSLVSDMCWAYAMLLTSPLIVTVGLSLTIPLSLVGQIILDRQYSSVMYWFGAAVVFVSFIFINREETKDELAARQEDTARAAVEHEFSA